MSAVPWDYLAVPILLWVALRRPRREAAAAFAALACASIVVTMRGEGPFARATATGSAISLIGYLAAMAAVTATVARSARARARAESQLLEQSMTDALTGLGNYRRLLDVLRAEIARSDRSKRPFALLVVDVAGLKRINDEHGHLAGSRALIRVAGALRQCCRTTDRPARFGGDEFAVVLAETDRVGAERLLARVAEQLRAGTEAPPVSISGGIAAYPGDGGTPGKLLGVAGETKRRG